MKPGVELIADERRRQVEVEHFDAAHDDQWTRMELMKAAALYHNQARGQHWSKPGKPPKTWPWDKSWWKPKTPLLDLIRAGALYLAESERCTRAKEHQSARVMFLCSERIAQEIDKLPAAEQSHE